MDIDCIIFVLWDSVRKNGLLNFGLILFLRIICTLYNNYVMYIFNESFKFMVKIATDCGKNRNIKSLFFIELF